MFILHTNAGRFGEMNQQTPKVSGKQMAVDAAATVPDASGHSQEMRSKFKALSFEHMPKDFSISLDAYRRGGTDGFLDQAPTHAATQPMRGFEKRYANIVDYIIRITHQIWEGKDIGYVYDTYSHDCMVWGELGLQAGRDIVVQHVIEQSNAFPDMRILADEVIWAGDDRIGFHTSHRSQIIGTNTGYSAHGAPTGKRIQFLCMANCVSRDNEIFYEHVAYDTCYLVKQLGFDPVETAQRAGEALAGSLPADFLSSEPKRTLGQSKPERVPIPDTIGDNPEEFVRAASQTIWNRRNLGAVDRVYAPSVVSEVTGGRVFHGPGQLRSFMLSLLAMFPDALFSIDDLYWMGNPAEGFLVAQRWSMIGSHRGHGRYGAPTGREVSLWGITQWVIADGRVTHEWTTFNEFGALVQILKS